MAGCSAEIGDECQANSDCSLNYDRTCDFHQPGGYCLIIGCEPNSCPEEASCVEFITPCPEPFDGAGPDLNGNNAECDEIEPNRKRTYCLKHCNKNDDCRSNYDCVGVADSGEPNTIPQAAIIDDSSKSKICVPKERI